MGEETDHNRKTDKLIMIIENKLDRRHSSTLAWKIPWTEEPGGLPSMGSHRVRYD